MLWPAHIDVYIRIRGWLIKHQDVASNDLHIVQSHGVSMVVLSEFPTFNFGMRSLEDMLNVKTPLFWHEVLEMFTNLRE